MKSSVFKRGFFIGAAVLGLVSTAVASAEATRVQPASSTVPHRATVAAGEYDHKLQMAAETSAQLAGQLGGGLGGRGQRRQDVHVDKKPRAADEVTMLANDYSGYCIDVAYGSKAAGARIQQWHCYGGPPERWRLVGLGNGVYNLVNVNSGMCLDLPNGHSGTPQGVALQQ